MSGRIAHIATALPAYRYAQSELLPYMLERHGNDPLLARQLRLLYTRSGIDHRHSVLPDFIPGRGSLLYGDASPGISQRLDRFKEDAIKLAARAARDCLRDKCAPSEITHLISVSCTGLFAPGLEFQLMKSLGLDPGVQRHPINFVGCYAAVPALSLARLICQSEPQAHVLLVSVELCSLHFQEDDSRDNLMANALFADGAAACLVVGEAVDMPAQLRLGRQHGEVHAQAEGEMAWIPSEEGFLMRLTSYVPKLIRAEIAAFVERALAAGAAEREDTAWAFHPGGIQILRKVEEAMDLDSQDLRHSYDVLRDCGNMSSATVLFVLERMLAEGIEQPHVFACAFGPGLTFESILLHRV